MQEKLVLIGGGGHCKSVLDTIYATGMYSEIVITDYDNPRGSMILECKVVGTDDEFPELFRQGFRHAFVTVGSIRDTRMRRRAYEKAKKLGFSFPTIIDPSAVIASSAQVGDGVFIGKKAVVNADVVIGDMSIINTGAIVEHDCSIGDFSHIAVNAVVCGGVRIASDVFIGANATIIQGVNIGMNNVIGAGAVVNKNLPQKCVAYGVPAKVKGEGKGVKKHGWQ